MSSAPRRALIVGLEVLLACLVSILVACALTWPMPVAMNDVVVGGGELGGWLWRYWWHSLEAEALGAADLPLLDRWSQLVSLGRYPETGNILDVIFITWPLSNLLDFPAHYNAKVLMILVGDGLCGYALARHFTRDRSIALVACVIAVANPLNIQDINGSGLRQCVLWWLLLYPIFLDRAARGGRLRDAILAGLCLGMAAAWYWFYGLFAAVFSGLYFGWHLFDVRPHWRALLRWLLPLSLATLLVAGPFVRPYMGNADAVGAALPEMTFFLPFPRYETIAEAPMRPASYEENVLASLHRTIRSSWAADYLVLPTRGERAWPFPVLLLGVLPLLWRRKGLFWVGVLLFFYASTLGPYLKLSTGSDADAVLLMGERWVFRMPWAWLFRWVPGMSRLFGPYRLASMLVVASVVVVALGMELSTRGRRWWLRAGLALLSVAFIMAQYLFLWTVDFVPDDAVRPSRWRAPIKVSHIEVPDFYRQLDPTEAAGIIELPLWREQDVLCYYQTIHHHKVFRSWATQGAMPPTLLEEGGGEVGARMRYLASEDATATPAAMAFDLLSKAPSEVAITDIDPVSVAALAQHGDYRYLIVHERGYYLLEPYTGPMLYQDAVRRLSGALGLEPEQVIEHQWTDYPGNPYGITGGPVYVRWSAEEINLHDRQMPSKLYMAIFDLAPLLERVEAEATAAAMEDGDLPEGSDPGGLEGTPGEEPGAPLILDPAGPVEIPEDEH
jgi:hypothetical protein